jgi:hypothetical protein
MARRTAAMSDVTPVEVSLCTTHTALIWWLLSSRRRFSMRSACTPLRHVTGRPVSSVPGRARNSVFTPRRVAILCHSEEKWPVSYMSTRSPGLVTLVSAASHAPVPEAG